MFGFYEKVIKCEIDDDGGDDPEEYESEDQMTCLGLDLDLGAVIRFTFTRQKILTERAFLEISSDIYFAVRTKFHLLQSFILVCDFRRI